MTDCVESSARRQQGVEIVCRDQHSETSRLPRRACNESVLLEGEHHLVDRGRRDTEVALHVGLGRRLAVHARVEVNEGEVASLLLGVGGVRHRDRRGMNGMIYERLPNSRRQLWKPDTS